MMRTIVKNLAMLSLAVCCVDFHISLMKYSQLMFIPLTKDSVPVAFAGEYNFGK